MNYEFIYCMVMYLVVIYGVVGAFWLSDVWLGTMWLCTMWLGIMSLGIMWLCTLWLYTMLLYTLWLCTVWLCIPCGCVPCGCVPCGCVPSETLFAEIGSSNIIVPNLLNDRKKMTVVGAPREKENGTVIIFELSQESTGLVKRDQFGGDQFGAGFGHSLASIDIKMDR